MYNRKSSTKILIRQLHPDLSALGNEEMLDSSNKHWRRKAERELNFTEGHFGGTFKEHLSVASLSPRCYTLAVDIMEMYGKWELKRQTNNKVNRMLFAQLPGVRNEDTIYRYLREFRQGKLSKAEFNEELKTYKRELQEERSMVRMERKSIKETSTTSTELRKWNMILLREKEALKLKLKNLESKLALQEDMQDHDSDFTIVTASERVDTDSDEEIVLFEAVLDDPYQIEKEDTDVLELPPMKYSRRVGSKLRKEEARNQDQDLDVEEGLQVEEDQAEFFQVQRPKFTYSRARTQVNEEATRDLQKEATSNAEKNFVMTLEKIHLLENRKKDNEEYFVCTVEEVQKDETVEEVQKDEETFVVDECVLAKDGSDDECKSHRGKGQYV
ncbi:uncharacterized protein LOC144625746 [Crassostrea virginica]